MDDSHTNSRILSISWTLSVSSVSEVPLASLFLKLDLIDQGGYEG